MKLSEVIKDKDKDKNKKEKSLKNKSKAEKEKEYLKRPEIQESLNILADYLDL
jgi:hypothetical protein